MLPLISLSPLSTPWIRRIIRKAGKLSDCWVRNPALLPAAVLPLRFSQGALRTNMEQMKKEFCRFCLVRINGMK